MCHPKDYGHKAEKATWLYSNYPFVKDVALFETGRHEEFGMKLAHTWTDRRGTRLWQGNPKELKESQVYTKGFGLAVRKTVLKNEHYIRKAKAELRRHSGGTSNQMVRDMFVEAELDSAMCFLGK